MTRHLISLVAASACLLLPVAASAAILSETVNVSAQSGPWSPALNPALPFGDGTNLAAAHTMAAFDFSAGAGFTLRYTGGLATPLSYGDPVFDGRGDTNYVATGTPGTSSTPFPSQYVPASFGTVYLGTLIGAFARDGVVVGSPFAVGNGIDVTSPGGVDEILLGYNDDIFNDNRGVLSVSITGTSAVISPVPLPGGAPLFGLAMLGLGGLGLLRRHARTAG